MKILVTGGAGYVGSHAVRELLKNGYEIVVYDNLSSGFKESLPEKDVKFIKGDLSDKDLLIDIFKERSIDAVIHLAAKIDVAESVKNPTLYHEENFLGSINLLEAMTQAGVDKIIFSSTAAVYGNSQYTPIDENHPTNPTNPYGQTKLDFEKYLEQTQNLKYIL